MTYFRDLDTVDYHDGPLSADCWQCPLLAIGWHEEEPFSTGHCAARVVERLVELRHQFAEAFPQFSFRGLHECSLCAGHERLLLDSHLNLFVPGEGVIYVATGRVDHYIEVHGYAPPPEFVDAVMKCPDPRSAQYASAVLGINGGERPPLFPEKWNIFKLDENRRRSRMPGYGANSEAAARKWADVHAARDQGHEYDFEREPDPWETAD